MKRWTGVVVIVGLVCVVHVSAQSVVDTSSASKWYLGVKGGFALSTVWGPDQPKAGTLVDNVLESMLPGVSAGLNFPIVLHPHFTLEPELLITTKGVKWTDTSNQFVEITQDMERRQTYVEIPVLAKLMMVKPEKRVRPMIYAGPQVSLALISTMETKGDGLRRKHYLRYTGDRPDSASLFDVGLVGGLGAHIRAGRGFFIIDARGAISFIDQDPTDAKIYRNVLGTLYVGYCFNPKKKKTLW